MHHPFPSTFLTSDDESFLHVVWSPAALMGITDSLRPLLDPFHSPFRSLSLPLCLFLAFFVMVSLLVAFIYKLDTYYNVCSLHVLFQ